MRKKQKGINDMVVAVIDNGVHQEILERRARQHKKKKEGKRAILRKKQTCDLKKVSNITDVY